MGVNLGACFFTSKAKRKSKMSWNTKRAIHTMNNNYKGNFNHRVLKREVEEMR